MTRDLPDTLRAIKSLLDAAGIRYMVVGSFAGAIYGVTRSTRDVDIVIDPSELALEQFLGSIDMAAFYVDPDVARDAFRRRTMFNIIDMETAWKLDLVIRKDRAFSVEELRRGTVKTVAGNEMVTATAEDTILAKLEWAKTSRSDRQFEDVAAIVRFSRTQLDRDYIERWLDILDVREQWNAAISIEV